MILVRLKRQCRSRLPQFPRTGFTSSVRKKGPKYPEPIQLGPSLPFPQTHPIIIIFPTKKPSSHIITHHNTASHNIILALSLSLSLFFSLSLSLFLSQKYPVLNHSPTLTRWSIEASNKLAIASIGSRSKVAPSASTLHEHPVVSCEPVIPRLSAFTATLFSIWSFHPTHNRLLTQI